MAKLKKLLITRKRQDQLVRAATNRFTKLGAKNPVMKAVKYLQNKTVGGQKIAHGSARPAAIKKQHGIITGKIKDSGPAPPKRVKSKYGKQTAPRRKKYKGDKPLPLKDAAEAKKKSHYRY